MWLIQGQRCSFTASASAILVNVPQKQAAYNASKAAQVHLAKSLAVEWADFHESKLHIPCEWTPTRKSTKTHFLAGRRASGS